MFTTRKRCALFFSSGVAGLSFLHSAHAAQQVLYDMSANQATYDGNISAGDLVNNGSTAVTNTSTTGSVAAYGGDVMPYNSFTHLTDGIASSKNNGMNDISGDTYFDGNSYGPGSPSITYTLGGSMTGYDITGVRSISGWSDTSTFANQLYNIEVAPATNPTAFVTLYNVNYANLTNTPFDNSGGGSSQLTLTDSTGTLASGIGAIRFTFLNNGGSGQVFREIDVTGSPTAVPEPASLGLLGLGAASLLGRRRRA